MNPILKNILAAVAGIIVGGLVNMGIVLAGPSIIPPPEGAEVTTMEGLKASMHLFEPRHFIMPFLAHAIGSLIGALVAGAIAVSRTKIFALGVSAWFLLGGIINVFLLPSPLWFTIVDLAGAYLPMGYLAGTLIRRPKTL